MGDSREREADPWTSRKACLTTEQSAFDDASGCCTMRVCRESARLTAVPLIAALGFSLVTPAFGDDASSGCQTLVQAGATGLAADLKADDATIHQPKSVTKFTCLGNFFNGVGLDVVTSKLNVASLAEAAMGKICSQLSSEWDSLQSSAHCGLSVTGLDTNFNLGLGAGSFCPNLSFGGGGDSLINAGTNTTGNQSWVVSGQSQLPSGYSFDAIGSSTGISRVSQ
ncbi:hypothetical protein [Gluconobacter oxydans]|uniref:Uncharacterized protein n=1 Tax=Gluconobacter oxydans (strain 621H) TaxID=290633 RepID=Q5HXS6_GLUOX|nr:hypothetical protein [Gluconobacter oxydans]AAW59677.1 hypothetical protein GOX2613 [Gluconobacter oxydans 621H]